MTAWQDEYFSADNQVKSAELGFWLGATPAADALTTPNESASVRPRPALQAKTGGVTPAIGPHSAAAHRARPANQNPRTAPITETPANSNCIVFF